MEDKGKSKIIVENSRNEYNRDVDLSDNNEKR